MKKSAYNVTIEDKTGSYGDYLIGLIGILTASSIWEKTNRLDGRTEIILLYKKQLITSYKF